MNPIVCFDHEEGTLGGGRGTDEMRIWINSLLNQYVDKVGALIPPIDPRIIAEFQNAVIRSRRGSALWIASIMPIGRGFIIYVQQSLPKNRERLAICHEIGHTFFFDTKIEPPRRHDKLRPDDTEERLCFWAAREMLIPTSLCEMELRKIERKNIFTYRGIVELASIFAVSPDAMATRLTHDLALLGDSWIILWYGNEKTEVENLENLSNELHPKPLYPAHVSKLILDWRKVEINKFVRSTVLKCLQEGNTIITNCEIGKKKPLGFAVRTEPVYDRPRLCAISWIAPMSGYGA